MALKHDILYAPWRKEYIHSNTKKESIDPKKCIFCDPLKDELILSTKRILLQANKYPYGEGHLLAIPKRHVNQIVDLTSKEREDLFNLIDLSVFALTLYMKPQGFNIGCSIGDVAGESIKHLHFHVLPRYKGDVSWSKLCNFEIISNSPKKLAEDVKGIITKHKLLKKFNL
jgi:ATP adenylyltransferase